jgi:hypothetical protein
VIARFKFNVSMTDMTSLVSTGLKSTTLAQLLRALAYRVAANAVVHSKQDNQIVLRSPSNHRFSTNVETDSIKLTVVTITKEYPSFLAVLHDDFHSLGL